MIEKQKTVYYCEFCGKKGLSKLHMAKHETMCSKNPANKRPCFDCAWLREKNAMVEMYGPDYTYEKEVSVLWCESQKHALYPPKVEIKGNALELCDDLENKPMPKACEFAISGRF